MKPEFWIIDDDTLYVRELIKAISAYLGDFKIITFVNSRPVLDALRSTPPKRPAGALVDMMLAEDEWDNPMDWPPDANTAQNGIEIVKELLAGQVAPEQIGVITAEIETSHLEPLFAAGFDRGQLLIKPALDTEIKQLVRRIVQAYRTRATTGS